MSYTHYLLVAQRACGLTSKNAARRPSSSRFYATHDGAPTPSKSRHASFYSDTLPAMIPVFLLGSAVFLGLQLTQLKLSHAKFMEEANERVAQLEAEIESLQHQRASELKASPQASSSTEAKSSQSWWRWW